MKNKQIEEIVRDVDKAIRANFAWDVLNGGYVVSSADNIAKELYYAGYRRASEVAREIFEEIENALELLQRGVEEGRKNDSIKYQQLHDGRILSIEAIKYFVAELKKK